MRYGICLGTESLDRVEYAAKIGFDYIETGFGGLSRAGEAEFAAFAKTLEKSGIRCEASNSFIPGDLKITGDRVDFDALNAYVESGMRRGAQIGLAVVVLGSSAARNLDDGTSYTRGFLQLAGFLRRCACPIAAKYGVEVVLEPLRRLESNIINTVKEGAMVAAASGCGNAGSLADLYHMHVEHDGFENIRDLKGTLKHAHISYPVPGDGSKRTFMTSMDEYDYAGFIDALEYAGCSRCSIEAGTDDYFTDADRAVAVINQLRQRQG